MTSRTDRIIESALQKGYLRISIGKHDATTYEKVKQKADSNALDFYHIGEDRGQNLDFYALKKK